jgi:hypothetical protein
MGSPCERGVCAQEGKGVVQVDASWCRLEATRVSRRCLIGPCQGRTCQGRLKPHPVAPVENAHGLAGH